MAMDKERCARILWALTSDYSVRRGEVQNLADLRLALAQAIFNTDGVGFPEPAQDPPVSDAWTRCARAASEADPVQAGSGPRYVVIWPASAQEPDMPEKEVPALGLHWPFTAKPSIVTGPVLDGSGREVKLFAYTSIDENVALEQDRDTGGGLFPRPGVNALASANRNGRTGVFRRRYPTYLPILLFGLSLFLAVVVMVWVYSVAGTLQSAGRTLLVGVELQGVAPNITLDFSNMPLAKTRSGEELPQVGRDANQVHLACLKMLQARMNGRPDDLGASPCYTALMANARALPNPSVFFEWSQRADRISLLLPMVISALAILALVFSAGSAQRDTLLGAAIDERNRLSLSRMQQLAWTMVLFGGYTVLAVVNLTLMAGVVRDVGQATVLSPDSGLTVGNFFPSMDPSLWAVLGLTVLISPFLSRKIMTNMEHATVAASTSSTTARGAAQVLDRRENPLWARWSDLFTGETEAASNQIDVSRLQHMVITVLLLGGYIILLAEYVRTIDACAVLLAMTMGAPVFASMPPIDPTFVGLLALSHAGYLAFKNPNAV